METATQPTYEELFAQLESLKIENDKLKKNKKLAKPYLKKSEKGAVQIMGIRKFPITLYKRELETIFNMKDEINDFIKEQELN